MMGNWLKQLAYFMLMISVIRNLAGKKYEKYMKFTWSLCLILLVCSPVLHWLRESGFQYELEREEIYLEGMGALNDTERADRKMIMQGHYNDLVREKSQEVLAEYGIEVVDAEVVVEEETITGMRLQIRQNEGKEAAGGITKIVVELVGKNTENGTAEKKNDYEAEMLAISVKDKLSEYYRMEREYIDVEVIGR